MCEIIIELSYSVSAFLSTLGKPESRSVTPAGSSTAWSMESSQTGRCPATRPLVVETIRSTPSSVKPGPESTCRALFSLILSQLSSVSRAVFFDNKKLRNSPNIFHFSGKASFEL